MTFSSHGTQSDDTEIPGAEQLWKILKEVYDPEIPVNLVDLGLIYSCRIDEGCADIVMTLTTPACSMAPAIVEEVKQKALSLPGVSTADVKLVWDPSWNQEMISETGRMQLGLI